MKTEKKNIKQIMLLILFAGLVLWISQNYKIFINLLKFVVDLIMPIIIGGIIAFIINVPMKSLEKNIFKINKRKHKKLIRILSLILSILFIFGVIGLLMFLVIPEFIEAIITIGKTVPINTNFINELIFHIGLVELISYWKSTCSPNVIIEAGYINDYEYLEKSGVNIKEAMAYFNNNQNLYNSKLQIFYTSLEERMSKLYELKKEQQFGDYSTMVTELKEDSKNLGFEEFAKIAEEHEKASEEKNIEFLNKNYPKFRLESANVLDIIKKHMER